MASLRSLLGMVWPGSAANGAGEVPDQSVLPEEETQFADRDLALVRHDPEAEERIERGAAEDVEKAAAASLRKLMVARQGRCPDCGAHLHQHLFAFVCEECGWHAFDEPRRGGIRVYLKSRVEPLVADRCYVTKPGLVIAVKNDIVIAQIRREAFEFAEYLWDEPELAQRRKAILARLRVTCAWCDGTAEPDKEGFHMVHAAFGSTQERYCFCSDDCYEAFRKMYPARVHRDCYNRHCAECDQCIKRYRDEAESIREMVRGVAARPPKAEKAAEASS